MTEFVTKINPEQLKNGKARVDVHLGDATLLAALHTLQDPHARAVVVDPGAATARKLIRELETGTPLYSFMYDDAEVATRYSSIASRILSDNYWRGFMRDYYGQLWEKAAGNSRNLLFVEARIQDLLASLEKPVPLADRVTYHYPSPTYDPRFPAFDLASRILKPDGIFEVTTENREVMEDFCTFGGDFVVNAGRRERQDNPFVSAYDIAWGRGGHWAVEMRNTEGEMTAYAANRQKSFVFKAMSMLGMVR